MNEVLDEQDIDTDVADEEEVEDDEEDEARFLKNGKIRLQIDSKVYFLRAPKLGEYREIVERVDQAQENEKLQREKGKKYSETDDVIGIFQFIFEKLGNRPPPPTDEWPTWICIGTFLSSILVHWREVPLVRGTGKK